MEDRYVAAGLVRNRVPIARQIEHLKDGLHQLAIDLDSLDATVRLSDPEIELGAIKPKPVPPKTSSFPR